LISNFRRVPNVACFPLGNSPGRLNFISRQYIKFRHRGITQKKAYNM